MLYEIKYFDLELKKKLKKVRGAGRIAVPKRSFRDSIKPTVSGAKRKERGLGTEDATGGDPPEAESDGDALQNREQFQETVSSGRSENLWNRGIRLKSVT